MRRNTRFWLLGSVVTLAAALMLLTTFALAASSGKGHHGRKAQHVRWDIISLVGGNFPGPANPGGHASAMAPDGDVITLTGSGTFVAPASGKGSRAARGGGTWTTSMGARGRYRVTALVSWTFANFQATTPTLIDNIDHGRRSNGTAVLKIRFSDGSTGVLTVGCHGPGAPPGIFEGIATTKGYKTYYAVQPPAAGVDANRTIFHLGR
jgi:hypothetical protein